MKSLAPAGNAALKSVGARLTKSYLKWNRQTRGWLSVFARAWNRFGLNHGAESAAAVAFFSIFSSIPLFVFVIRAASNWIAANVVRDSIANFLATAFPVSLERLMEVISPLLNPNGSLDLIATLGFLWAASNMFSFLLVGINRSWNSRATPSAVRDRLLALAFVTAMAVLVALLLLFSFALRLLAGFIPQVKGSLRGILLPVLTQAMIVYVLYKLGPSARVSNSAALIGAGIATVAIELTTRGFGWYLNDEVSFYNVYYGSLGAIIGLLFWLYLCCYILLYGAYLSEAVHARATSTVPGEFLELPRTFSTPELHTEILTSPH